MSIVLRLLISLIIPVWGAIVLGLGILEFSVWWITTGFAILVFGFVLLVGSPLLRRLLYDS